jgi:hypothetical protein
MARASTHARDFLNIADTETAAHDLLETTLRLAVRNRAARGTLRSVERWTRDQLELLGIAPDRAIENQDVLDLLAAAEVVAARVPARLPGRPATRLHFRVAALLDGLEPDFVPELLQETRRRSADEPAFAARLREARRAVVDRVRALGTLRREIASTVPDEQADDPGFPVVLTRANSQAEEVAVGVFVAVLVVMVVIAWIASEDPAKE